MSKTPLIKPSGLPPVSGPRASEGNSMYMGSNANGIRATNSARERQWSEPEARGGVVLHRNNLDNKSYTTRSEFSPFDGASARGTVSRLNRQNTIPHSSPDPHIPNSRVGR